MAKQGFSSATQSLVIRSFVSGEQSPDLFARADLARYVSGARLIRNFIVQRGGGLTKRPGTQFVAEVKDSSYQPRYVKFIFEADDQSYLIELGDHYARFYWHRAPVMDPGNPAIPLEIATPYSTADVLTVFADQETDTVTLTHPSYPVYELKRVAHNNWTCLPVSFAPVIFPPTGLAGTVGVPPTATANMTFRYKVTAFKGETFEESVGSAIFALGPMAQPTTAAPNTITWTAVTGAVEYGVYLDTLNNGIYGFIGLATTNKFYDPGISPDSSITPPILKAVFDAAGKYPAKACHFQQRRLFANSNTDHEKVWGSRIATFKNFTISTPLRDDDAVEFVIAGKHLNPVMWMVPLSGLVLFNDEGAFIAGGDSTGTLTPLAIGIEQIGFNGAHPHVEPVVVQDSIIYVDESEMRVRHLSVNNSATTRSGFVGGDKTITANHLFDGFAINDIDFSQHPHSCVWAVRSDGILLGFTYVPDEEVEAWHQHDVGGEVQQVCVLPHRPGDDDVYLLVARTIDGDVKRYLEVLGPRWVPDKDDLVDAFYVDCGLSYDAAPATVFSNLDHLEGERVAVLADGVVLSNGYDATTYTIESGVLTPALTTPASRVHVGKAMVYSDLETLELDVQGTSIRPLAKLVKSVVAILRSSRQAFYIGPDAAHLTLARQEPWETATALVSQQSSTIVTADWNDKGKVFLRHIDPLPFMVLGLVPQLEAGA